MEFVLTTYGQNLLQDSGTPVSLTYQLGSSVNYTPQASDTGIHGSEVGIGTTLSVQGTGINQPSYPIILNNDSIPTGPFGEIGLFLGGDMVALASNATLISYGGEGTLSVLCVLPPVSGESAMFSPMAVTGQTGIGYLPSLDSLPRASTVLNNYTANVYGFLNDDIIAASGGQWWRLVGTNLVQRTQVSTPITANTINLAAALTGNPADGTLFYVSIATGPNAGLVRKASQESSTSLVIYTPLPYDFDDGDWIYVYNVVFTASITGSGGGVDELSELIDVSLSSPQNGDLLEYSTDESKWVNASAELVVQEI